MKIAKCKFSQISKYFYDLAYKDDVHIKPDRDFFCAIIENEIVGIVGYKVFSNNTCKLNSDFVLKEHRGKGIYNKLNEYRMYHLKSIGVNLIRITCTPDSIHLHRKNGATETRRFKNCVSFQYKL